LKKEETWLERIIKLKKTTLIGSGSKNSIIPNIITQFGHYFGGKKRWIFYGTGGVLLLLVGLIFIPGGSPVEDMLIKMENLSSDDAKSKLLEKEIDVNKGYCA